LGNRLHRRGAWFHLMMKAISRFRTVACLPMDNMSLAESKARVGAKQQRCATLKVTRRLDQLGCQWHHPLDVVFGLTGRVLCAGAQGQFQAKALRAQVHGQWAVAIDSRVGAAHMLLRISANVTGHFGAS
ncbi:MAG: hypothetical protein WBL16_12575, partial [Zwartia sp.]